MVLGALAKAGRDKLTLVVDPAIGALGAWLEQLVAESTGKAGVGIVPVDREPLGAPACVRRGPRLRPDRPRRRGSPASGPDGSPADALLDALAAAGHPVLRFTLTDPIDLAAEFLRWEVATAIAGIVLGVNPFDEPNVTESKENTKRVLEELEHHGAFPREEPLASGYGIALHGDTALRLTAGDGSVVGELRRHLARVRPGGYLAIGAFVAPTAGRADGDRSPPWPPPRRHRPRDDRRLRAALPPLHRPAPQGRPGDRLVPPAHERPPGRPAGPRASTYTFGQLIDAQARGDIEALEAHDLPVLRVHLGADVDAGLAALDAAIAEALRQ